MSILVTARNDVYKIMHEVAEIFNVNLYQLPMVFISDEENSHASPSGITIHSRSVNNKETYAEETAHYLRFVASNEGNLIVQQFFGGLARLLVSKRNDTEDTERKLLENAILLDAIYTTNPSDEENALSLASCYGYLLAHKIYKESNSFLRKYPDIIKKSDSDVRTILNQYARRYSESV